MNKDLILGTALWGWKVEESECFKILDYFYDNKFNKIDLATNYPINYDINSFRLSETIVEKWIKKNNVNDLKLIIKIGSIDNSGSTYNNLNYDSILKNFEYYSKKFKNNLWNIMIHWDNRNDKKKIIETIGALKVIKNQNINIGLSGIKYMKIYSRVLFENNLIPLIECKHNIFDSYVTTYKEYFPSNQIYVYGINLGGLNLSNIYDNKSSISLRGIDTSKYENFLKKLNEIINKYKSKLTFKIKTLNQISFIEISFNKNINGLIIGPSSLTQMIDSVSDYNFILKENINNFIFENIIKELNYN